MRPLDELSASEFAACVRAGEMTAEDVTRRTAARVANREGAVGAWVHFDPEKALEKARSVDRRQAGGEILGRLAGVPVGIKDIIDTKDWPTEYGSDIFAGRQPAEDAEVVKRLEAAGAVIFGKTVTTELAFYGPGKTRNPRDLSRTPGGSSSGSAAAVADGHVPLALGSQTAGSIIGPASYCGVVGMKPTFGWVPLDGVLEQSRPLDTLGGYGRTLGDVALSIEVLSGRPLTGANIPENIRLAFVKSHAWPDGDFEMRSAVEAFAKRATPGVEIVEVALPAAFDCAGGLQRAVQFHDIAESYGPIVDANPQRVSAKLREIVAIGRSVSEAEYRDALGRRDALYAALLDTIAGFDAILTPAAQGVAPLGLESTGSPMFNFLWTYLGVPAISLPLLDVGGLPLGVQLVGRRDEDANLIAVATAFEVATAS